MWLIYEARDIGKVYPTLPPAVRQKYELWKSIVQLDGPAGLRQFKGFHDEKLKGKRSGQRSSRLSKRFRVIYEVDQDVVTVFVEEITPHDY
jgi:proteic killer suppression protein